jgi:hypothetical protein
MAFSIDYVGGVCPQPGFRGCVVTLALSTPLLLGACPAKRRDLPEDLPTDPVQTVKTYAIATQTTNPIFTSVSTPTFTESTKAGQRHLLPAVSHQLPSTGEGF